MADVEKGTGTHKPEFDGEWVRLGDVCEINPRQPKQLSENETVSFLPLSLVNVDGTTELGEDNLRGDVAKGHPWFKNGDLLVAKITPSFENGKIARAKTARADGYASTEFHVVRPMPNVVDSAYVLAYLRSVKVRCHCAARMTGSAGQRRVPSKVLAALEMPFVPLKMQTAVGARFLLIDRQLRLYQKQLSALDDLVKSQFVEMFGSDRYPVVRASEVLTNFRNGVSPSKTGKVHSDVLTLSSITRGRFDAAACKDGAFEEMPQADKRVSSRDFYICRGNGNKKLVGVAAFAEEDHPDLVFPDTMIAATVNDSMVCQSYLAYEWAQPNVRRQIESKARTTNGTFKINQKTIAGVQIPLPPLEEQIKFADFVARVDKLGFDVQQQIEKLETLKRSLMQEYFG